MCEAYQVIIKELNKKGFLMLNENPKYCSICGLGGGWNDAIRLIEERKAFLTKLIDGKATYLSVGTYKALQSLEKSCFALSEREKDIFDFISKNGEVNSKVLQSCVPISRADLQKALLGLQNKLLVTAVGQDEKLNDNWGTYVYATALDWETKSGESVICKDPEIQILNTFRGAISIKKLSKLTGRKILKNAHNV